MFWEVILGDLFIMHCSQKGVKDTKVSIEERTIVDMYPDMVLTEETAPTSPAATGTRIMSS